MYVIIEESPKCLCLQHSLDNKDVSQWLLKVKRSIFFFLITLITLFLLTVLCAS